MILTPAVSRRSLPVMDRHLRLNRRVSLAGLLTAALLATPLIATTTPAAAQPQQTQAVPALIPQPTSQHALPNQSFTLQPWSIVGVDSSAKESRAAKKVADQLTTQLRRSTGYLLPVLPVLPGFADIRLSTNGPASLGAEGYQLRADRSHLTVTAATPEGLYRGVTTLRQLLPAKADAKSRQAGPWRVAGTTISDSPRYAYRGAMLDVARHFFSVAAGRSATSTSARCYKLNMLHLHLARRPGLADPDRQLAAARRRTAAARRSAATPGGSYTKAQYSEIVRYAAAPLPHRHPRDRHSGPHQRRPGVVRAS